MANAGMLIIAAFGALHIALVMLPRTTNLSGIHGVVAPLGMLMLFTAPTSLVVITLAEASHILLFTSVIYITWLFSPIS